MLAALALVALLAACGEQAGRATQGDSDRGRAALARYACGTCHRIPGVHDANGTIGPPLDGLGKRVYLAGKLPNTPAHLAQWIRAPEVIKPGTAMPNVGATEEDARDMAAYLGGLR
jgi:cytochrome c1